MVENFISILNQKPLPQTIEGNAKAIRKQHAALLPNLQINTSNSVPILLETEQTLNFDKSKVPRDRTETEILIKEKESGLSIAEKLIQAEKLFLDEKNYDAAEAAYIEVLASANNNRMNLNQTQDYQAVANILQTLGDISLAKINSLGDVEVNNEKVLGDTLLKAVILYNAALTINEKYIRNLSLYKQLITCIKSSQQLFIEKIKRVTVALEAWEVDEAHRTEWKRIKKSAEEALKQVDAIKINSVEDHEAFYQRACLTENIYESIAKNIKALIGKMIDECITVLGNPPCKYAFICFGSLAKVSATPYSDIEFGILLEEAQDTKVNKQYFRNLSYLLGIKITNLGQTVIPRTVFKVQDELKIDLDDILVSGLQLDLGGKTPLGRSDRKYDLIATPSEMANYAKDEYFEIDKFLPIEIANFAHLHGDSEITQQYEQLLEVYFEKFYFERAKQVLQTGFAFLPGDLIIYSPTLYGLEHGGRAYQIKKEIYRLPDRFVEGLSLIYGFCIGSNKEKINHLKIRHNITELAANNLWLIDSLAKETRLRNYLINKGQRELVAIIPYQDDDQNDTKRSLLEIFNTTDYEYIKKILLRFYATTLPLHDALKTFFADQDFSLLKANNFYRLDERTHADVYMRVLDYQTVVKVLQPWVESEYRTIRQALQQESQVSFWKLYDFYSAIVLLSTACLYLNQFDMAKDWLENAEDIERKNHSFIFLKSQSEENTKIIANNWYHNQAVRKNTLATLYLLKEKHQIARKYFNEVLTLYNQIYTEHEYFVDTKANLAIIDFYLSEKFWRDNKFLEAEQLRTYAKNKINNLITECKEKNYKIHTIRLHNILANIYFIESNYEYAKRECDVCLKALYKQYSTIHPFVIEIKELLAKIYTANNEFEEAQKVYKSLIQIFEAFKKQGAISNHKLALIKTSMANYLVDIDEYEEAYSKAKSALDIYQKNNITDPFILYLPYLHYVRGLVQLAIKYYQQGQGEQAFEYLTEASIGYKRDILKNKISLTAEQAKELKISFLSADLFVSLAVSAIKNYKIAEAKNYLYYLKVFKNIAKAQNLKLENTSQAIDIIQVKLDQVELGIFKNISLIVNLVTLKDKKIILNLFNSLENKDLNNIKCVNKVWNKITRLESLRRIGFLNTYSEIDNMLQLDMGNLKQLTNNYHKKQEIYDRVIDFIQQADNKLVSSFTSINQIRHDYREALILADKNNLTIPLVVILIRLADIESSYHCSNNFLYAAFLYQLALRYVEEANVKMLLPIINIRFNKLEHQFIANVACTADLYNPLQPINYKIEQYVAKLNSLREQVKNEIAKSNSENRMKQIYNKLFHDIRDLFSSIFKYSVEELKSYIGDIPCPYAVIALGSMSCQEMTPYSDIEFAILIQEPNPAYKQYFRYLTQWMLYKLIRLGETTPRIMNITWLPTLQTCPLKKGFTFDGQGQGGYKTPLGGINLNGKRFELIGTPYELAQFQDEIRFEADSLLANTMNSISLITASKTGKQLIKRYHQVISDIVDKPSSNATHKSEENLTLRKDRALQLLMVDASKFEPRLGKQEYDTRTFSVKHDLYRLPTLILLQLKHFYNLDACGSYEIIAQLYKKEIILLDLKNYLEKLLNNVLYLRLKSYLDLGEQAECIMIKQEKQVKNNKIFYIDKQDLFGIFAKLIELHEAIFTFLNSRNKERFSLNQRSIKYDTYINARIHHLLGNYPESIKLYGEYIGIDNIKSVNKINLDQKTPSQLKALSYLVVALCDSNKFREAKNILECICFPDNFIKSLKKHETEILNNDISSSHNSVDSLAHEYIKKMNLIFFSPKYYIGMLQNLAFIEITLGNFSDSELYNKWILLLLEISNHQQTNDTYIGINIEFFNTLAMSKTYNEPFAHSVAILEYTYNNACMRYGQSSPLTLNFANNLAMAYRDLKGKENFKKAVDLFLMLEKYDNDMYGIQHVNYATTLNNIGLIYLEHKKDISTAIDYFQRAEAILVKLSVNTIKLAELYHNLAICYGFLSSQNQLYKQMAIEYISKERRLLNNIKNIIESDIQENSEIQFLIDNDLFDFELYQHMNTDEPDIDSDIETLVDQALGWMRPDMKRHTSYFFKQAQRLPKIFKDKLEAKLENISYKR